MRTKSSIINIIFSLLVQLITTLCSFFTRTALINEIGIDAVSLNGLFGEVIAMLSLAELGVGSSIVYNLYRPLAENDTKKVSELMNLFAKAYRLIAVFTFAIGSALIPWIQYIVNDVNYSDKYIKLVYFLFVIQTSSSYLFAYKTSLLNADQKKYINSIVTAIVKIIGTIILILILKSTHNYIVFLTLNIFFNVSINIVTSIIVDRKYGYLDKKAILSKNETSKVFSNVKNIFIKTLSGKITNSTDNILISILVSTTQVGYYSNYAMFFNIIKQLASQFGAGIGGSVGNLLASDDHKYSQTVLNRLTFLFYLCASLGTICLYCALEPFITIWIGKSFLLPSNVVIICCINSFYEFARIPLWKYIDASGLFAEDRNIAISGSAINLFISVLLGATLGIEGIFLGTLATYLIQIIMKTKLLYKKFFMESPLQCFLSWIKLSFTFFMQLALSKMLVSIIPMEASILKVIVCILIGFLISVCTNFFVFRRTDEFKYCTKLILCMVKK